MSTIFGWEGKGRCGHSISGRTRGVQVKLWDPMRTRAIPECLRGVFTTRCYTNPRLATGKAKAGMVHSVCGWMRGVQVKLWDLLRTHAIPECLRGVFTTRRYTNPRLSLPYLHLITVRTDHHPEYGILFFVDPYGCVRLLTQMCLTLTTLYRSKIPLR